MSVRGLAVFVFVIGAGLGWIVRTSRLQREAVVAIERAGGNVVYEVPLGKGRFNRGDEPPWAKWVAKTLGVDTFCRVWSVRFYGRPSDAEMVYIGRLSALEDLMLTSAYVSDAGIVHLESLTNLHNLYLGNTQVSDAGLAHLKSLTYLEMLDLRRTQVSDVGLAHLKGLTYQKTLDLSDTRISDVGLAHFKGLTCLKTLHLSGTQVSGAGVNELKKTHTRLTIFTAF